MTTSYRKEQVTLPPLSFKDRERAYIKVLSPMHKSEAVSEKDDKRNPATVMKVINLEDGLAYYLICPSLLVSSMELYGDEYVGKAFEIEVTADKLPGKAYKGVQCWEIDPNVDYSEIALGDDDASEADKPAAA